MSASGTPPAVDRPPGSGAAGRPPARGGSGIPAQTANEAIKGLGTAAVSFVVTLFYIGIATVATTHAQLLRGHDLRLPLLDVEVPVLYFFRIASWMVVVLHLLLLLQVHALVTRLRDPGVAGSRPPSTVPPREELLPSVIASALLRLEERRWLRRLVRLLLVILIFLLPLALLGLIQAQFVPYHNTSITRWFHQLPLLLDIVLAVALVPLILSPTGRWLDWLFGRPDPRGMTTRRSGCYAWVLYVVARVIVLTIVGFAVVFCLGVAVVPGARGDRFPGVVADFGFSRNLDASGRPLVDDERVEAWRQARAEGRSIPTLDLSGRDLRDARFSGTSMVGADLRGSDLTGAELVGTDLRGADLSPLPGRDGEPPKPTLFVDADLKSADLRGARLERAVLRGAELDGADLRGADLGHADLRLAGLGGARLAVADLSYADLRGAVLDRAEAACADFYAADLRGVRALALEAPAADLRRARLQGARLVGIRLAAVELRDAITTGGDLRDADLGLSTGLTASALDLRDSGLSGAWISASGDQAPRFSDLRNVETGEPRASVEARVESLLRAQTSDLEARPEVLPRLEECRSRLGSESLSEGPRGTVSVMDALELARWRHNLLDRPPPAAGAEHRYHDRLLDELLGADPGSPGAPAVSQADGCTSLAIAGSLVLRAWGCSRPRDPMLESRLRERIAGLLDAPESCPAFERVAAVAELPGSPAPSAPLWREGHGIPRWEVPATDCLALEQSLRELAAGQRLARSPSADSDPGDRGGV